MSEIWDSRIKKSLYLLFIFALLMIGNFLMDVTGAIIAIVLLSIFVFARDRLKENKIMGYLYIALIVALFIVNVAIGLIFLMACILAFFRKRAVIIGSVINFICLSFALSAVIVAAIIFTYIVLPLLGTIEVYWIALICLILLWALLSASAILISLDLFGPTRYTKINSKKIILICFAFALVITFFSYSAFIWNAKESLRLNLNDFDYETYSVLALNIMEKNNINASDIDFFPVESKSIVGTEERLYFMDCDYSTYRCTDILHSDPNILDSCIKFATADQDIICLNEFNPQQGFSMTIYPELEQTMLISEAKSDLLEISRGQFSTDFTIKDFITEKAVKDMAALMPHYFEITFLQVHFNQKYPLKTIYEEYRQIKDNQGLGIKFSDGTTDLVSHMDQMTRNIKDLTSLIPKDEEIMIDPMEIFDTDSTFSYEDISLRFFRQTYYYKMFEALSSGNEHFHPPDLYSGITAEYNMENAIRVRILEDYVFKQAYGNDGAAEIACRNTDYFCSKLEGFQEDECRAC